MKKLTILFLLFCTNAYAQTVVYNASFIGANIGDPPFRLMPMGDSITEGTGNTPWGYRDDLQDDLLPYKYDFVGFFSNPTSSTTYDVNHSGVSGDQVTNLTSRISSELSTYFKNPQRGDIVTIMIGTNDTNSINSALFSARVDLLKTDVIDVIRAWSTDIDIYIMTIPPKSADLTDTATWNGLLSTMVSSAGYSNMYLVDVNAAFNDTNNCSPDYSTCMADGFHPNTLGHTVLAETLSAAIKANLGH